MREDARALYTVHFNHTRMTSWYKNHLKSYRKQGGLSQTELAQLLGRKDRTSISRIESGARNTTYRELFGLEVVFGVRPSVLFPTYYEAVEEHVMRHAAVLSAKIERRSSRTAILKRRLFASMMSRAGNASGV
jgi:transcriptional regulator with XRE-family HTH domain